MSLLSSYNFTEVTASTAYFQYDFLSVSFTRTGTGSHDSTGSLPHVGNAKILLPVTSQLNSEVCTCEVVPVGIWSVLCGSLVTAAVGVEINDGCEVQSWRELKQTWWIVTWRVGCFYVQYVNVSLYVLTLFILLFISGISRELRNDWTVLNYD